MKISKRLIVCISYINGVLFVPTYGPSASKFQMLLTGVFWLANAFSILHVGLHRKYVSEAPYCLINRFYNSSESPSSTRVS